MAAIAKTQVSLYPTALSTAEWAEGGPVDKQYIVRRLKITNVTAADTATAAVLGVTTVLHVLNCYNLTTDAVVTAAVNPATNLVLIGAGPSAGDLYITIAGVPLIAPVAS